MDLAPVQEECSPQLPSMINHNDNVQTALGAVVREISWRIMGNGIRENIQISALIISGNNGGLSGGASAGAVVGSVVGALAKVAAAAILWRKRKGTGQTAKVDQQNRTPPPETSDQAIGTSGDPSKLDHWTKPSEV